jgi:hypothetical protein
MQMSGGIPVADELAPLTTPGCIVKVKHVSLAFECRAEPTHAGLVLINDQVFLAFACGEHKSKLIAPRRILDRDRAELERRRHSWTWARAGHPPLPIEPLRTGTAARRLVEQARVWADRTGSVRTRLVRPSATAAEPMPLVKSALVPRHGRSRRGHAGLGRRGASRAGRAGTQQL